MPFKDTADETNPNWSVLCPRCLTPHYIENQKLLDTPIPEHLNLDLDEEIKDIKGIGIQEMTMNDKPTREIPTDLQDLQESHDQSQEHVAEYMAFVKFHDLEAEFHNYIESIEYLEKTKRFFKERVDEDIQEACEGLNTTERRN